VQVCTQTTAIGGVEMMVWDATDARGPRASAAWEPMMPSSNFAKNCWLWATLAWRSIAHVVSKPLHVLVSAVSRLKCLATWAKPVNGLPAAAHATWVAEACASRRRCAAEYIESVGAV